MGWPNFNLNDFQRRSMMMGNMNPGVNLPVLSGMNSGPIMGPDMSMLNPPQSMMQEPEEDLYGSMFDMYNRPSPAMEQFKAHIANMPDRSQFKTGIGGRIAAGLIGASEGLSRGGGAGFQAAQQYLDQPYQTALDDYKLKGSSLGTLADIEATDIKNKAGLAASIAEQRRNDAKAAAEIKRWAVQNGLTVAQTEKALKEAGIVGKSARQNELTRELEIFDISDGSRVSTGKTDRSLAEKDAAAVKLHGQKGAIDLAQDKDRLNFEIPLRGAQGTADYQQRRMFAVNNPIPNSAYDSLASSQSDISDRLAVRQVIMENRSLNPGWSKFVPSDTNPERVVDEAIAADPAGYKKFLGEVKTRREAIENRNYKVKIGPKLSLDGETRAAPGVAPGNDSALRQKAIAWLGTGPLEATPKNIDWALTNPEFLATVR